MKENYSEVIYKTERGRTREGEAQKEGESSFYIG
jgi:hypothetical protein